MSFPLFPQRRTRSWRLRPGVRILATCLAVVGAVAFLTLGCGWDSACIPALAAVLAAVSVLSLAVLASPKMREALVVVEDSQVFRRDLILQALVCAFLAGTALLVWRL